MAGLLKERQDTHPQVAEDPASKPKFLSLTSWAERRLGKPQRDITISDVQRALPARPDLPDPPFTGPKGGRVRFRLRAWPSPERAAELRARAKKFRASFPKD
jgi:hypothetical protein